jgi:hypothetical protein
MANVPVATCGSINLGSENSGLFFNVLLVQKVKVEPIQTEEGLMTLRDSSLWTY